MSAKSQTAQEIALQTDAAPASVSYRCLHSQKPRLDQDLPGKEEKAEKFPTVAYWKHSGRRKDTSPTKNRNTHKSIDTACLYGISARFPKSLNPFSIPGRVASFPSIPQ